MGAIQPIHILLLGSIFCVVFFFALIGVGILMLVTRKQRAAVRAASMPPPPPPFTPR